MRKLDNETPESNHGGLSMTAPDSKIDILLVDDREDGLIALEAVLIDNKNYNLVKAHSGLEAIGLLPDYNFAVILLDVQMPGLDGFQTAELIRRSSDFQLIPIVFVTAINKDERYVYRGYEAGAVDYVFKPFDPVILRSKVAVFADLHLKNKKIKFQAEQLAESENRAHQALLSKIELENLRRYQNLAESIPHLVWRASSDGALEYFSQRWHDYTGFTIAESVGSGWQAAFHKDDLRQFLKLWLHSIESGDNFNIEGRLRSKTGEYRWHWIQAVAEKNSNGKIVAWLGTCSDIEDRKVTELKLVEAQKSAEAANEAKTQFLANMSHEIRTPLNAIIGFTELLLDPKTSASEKLDNLSIVRRNGQQLLKIINEILDISKVEAGRLELELIDTDLTALISGVRSLMNIHAVKKNVKLEFLASGNIPARVMTDSTRLQQILLNVVGNALKFTSQGEVKVSVNYFTKTDGSGSLRFRISDTGIGLSESVSERIFSPFSQADSSTTRIYGGTGLGLPLSRKLARALGGDLWLQKSRLGEGSVFVVEISAEVPYESSWVSSFSDLVETLIPIPAYKSSVSLEGRRILLVEDAEDNQLLISRFLKKHGAEIEIAKNGREGVEKALALNFEVILMDIQMPFVDGYEATSRLRQAGYQKPIIALTAHALREEREKCLRIGCNSHLTKPINRQQLVETILHLVESH